MLACTHKTITRLAIDLCQKHLLEDVLDCKQKDAIIQGSEDEDEKDLYLRATNWHFYKSNDKIPARKWFLLKITSENILDKRIKKFEGLVEKNSFKRYNKFGRILHHIQDMSTPSHVLPIYHGPKFPLYLSPKKIEDHFETFMYKNDDNITLEDVHIPSSDNNINSFFQIYDNAAHEMLEMLKNGFYIDSKHSQKLPYSLFWKCHTEEEFSKIKGFGVYGECNDYFIKDDLLKHNKYGITYDTLLSIQKTITTHAIMNTCKAILYAYNKGMFNNLK